MKKIILISLTLLLTACGQDKNKSAGIEETQSSKPKEPIHSVETLVKDGKLLKTITTECKKRIVTLADREKVLSEDMNCRNAVLAHRERKRLRNSSDNIKHAF